MLSARVSVVAFVLASGVGAAHAQVGVNDALVNPNLATAEQLATVPHIDTAAATAIADGRPYLTPAALDKRLQALSLTAQQRAEVYGRLFVPLNLNTASSAEMQLVPGVGRRMAHEFEEYRPWRGGILRFRREIGKYVDDDEVARLERYVFVPLDLNTASREDLLSIPGVGDRLAREFEEYRPYVNMAQFRREIGKYVADHEAARLARYFVLHR